MKRLHYILIGLAVLSLFVIIFSLNQSKTTGNVIGCNAPSILIEGVCCTDLNSDGACDVPKKSASTPVTETPVPTEVPETQTEVSETQYKNFEARMYLSADVIDSENALPGNPSKESQFVLGKTYLVGEKKYYGKFSLYTYLDGIYDENVICSVNEYYDDVSNPSFSVGIAAGQKFGVTDVGYEFDGTPSKVRYDMTCTGSDSGKSFEDSYTYNLVKS